MTPKQRVVRKWPRATCSWLHYFKTWAVHKNRDIAELPIGYGGSAGKAWREAANQVRRSVRGGGA